MRSRVLTTFVLIIAAGGAFAAEEDWPKEVIHPKAKVIMYQPQVESLVGDELQARAAVSVTLNDETEPYFGAVWITTRIDVDRSTRTVSYRNIRIPNVRFPEAKEEHKAELTRFLEEEMPTWEITDPLDGFIPLLEPAEHTTPNTAGIKHEPPRIIHSTVPAVLVTIDGKPQFQTVPKPEKAKKKGIQRMVNTAYPVIFYPSKKTHYLFGGGELWFTASDALGPYEPAAEKVPKIIREITPELDEDAQEQGMDPPEIIVATEPTELIVTDGEPDYVPLGELEILQLTNTEADILVDMSSRRHFVLLSGRWFSSPSALNGPWSFVEPGDLPEDFAEIPDDSQVAHLRAHVPGTIEANEAALDATIPQTSAIQRDDTSLKVQYDGEPKFEDVEETTLQYAVNSPQSVFKLGSAYYACEQGVWYEASSATGPWKVCTDVPPEIYKIPASNPHHNVTYVEVYDVTPEVVRVGYTPGYAGSYVYGGCVVWGTGWYYPGWYGRYYYPRPSTWGFHASYSPWAGWGFGVSWSNGPFSFGFGGWGGYWGYPYHGWWGPIGWRPPYYRPPYHRPPGYHPPHGGTRPPGSGGGTQPRPEQPTAGGGAGSQPKNNLYSQDRNANRNAARPATSDRTRPATANQPNNLFADRDGNVYRRDQSGGWQSREDGQWKPGTGTTPSTPSTKPSQPSTGVRPSQPSTRPSQPSTGVRPSQPSARPSQPSTGWRPSQPSTRPSYPSGRSLNRDYGARSRSQMRSQQFRSAPRTMGPSRGATMRRGGGMRRR